MTEPWERGTTEEERIEHAKTCRSCQGHIAVHININKNPRRTDHA